MSYSLKVVIICALCTLLERALPFLIFRNREIPKTVSYLGKVLPMTIIATLVIYCLRNTSLNEISSVIPTLVAVIITVAVHLWKNNTLLSILSGTAACMILTQLL